MTTDHPYDRACTPIIGTKLVRGELRTQTLQAKSRIPASRHQWHQTFHQHQWRPGCRRRCHHLYFQHKVITHPLQADKRVLMQKSEAPTLGVKFVQISDCLRSPSCSLSTEFLFSWVLLNLVITMVFVLEDSMKSLNCLFLWKPIEIFA